MRILLVSHYFWPESFRINQMVEDLIAAGAEVTVLTGHPSYPGGKTFPGYDARRMVRQRHPAGYEIIRVPVVPRGSGRAIRLTLNYLSFVVTGILFGTWLLRGRRFDVVFVYCTTPAIQGFVALWFGLIKRAKVVQWVQDLWPQVLSATGFVKNRLILGAVHKIVRFMYRRSDLVLGQSYAFVRFLAPDAGRTAVRYFPNPGEHPPGPDASPAPALPDAFNVVFGGNLGTLQAVETITAAAELLRDDPDIQVHLVGSGSMSNWLDQAKRDRQVDNLTLHGRLPPDAMPAVYAQASALLLTLVDDVLLAQTVPSKFQSYLAAGVPVIAAVNGEAAELVAASGAGLAVPAENVPALAAAIRTLKAMPPERRRAMGEAACRFYASNYKPDALARTLLAALDELAAGRGSGSALDSLGGKPA